MDTLSLSRNESFFSEGSSPESVFEHRTPTLDSCSSCSGANTPNTEPLDIFDSHDILLTNHSSGDEFILVVGGLGFIGSHTSWELLRSGQNVIIIDNLSNSDRNVLDKLEYLRDVHYKTRPSWPTLDFYQGDYRDRTLLHTIFTKYKDPISSTVESISSPKSKISGVIHFAAYKSVAESFKKPLAYYSNNVGGLVDFCSTLSDFNIKTLVFSSSATVYGGLANKGGALLEDQCDNTGCSGITNPYGRTKWMCEAILKDLAVSDPTWNITVLRYFNPIGCDESGILGEAPIGMPNNLMPVVIRAMTGELPALNVFGTDWDTPDGTAVRDFIHVSDLAHGHLAALKPPSSQSISTNSYNIYNLGSGTGHSVREVVTAMEDVSGRVIPVYETGRRQGDVGISIADTSKSAASLNWTTQKTLTQACRDICRYLGYIGEQNASEKK
ncbi:related to UDP-glucose 4-epimerase [Phialocephala subalpina]|uniref:Related to UDP-glucose 4-epimerase n=1 Tax=Phialocephala subalpina TaxID=576137 RepID=A0A1L7X0K7_9HELO|nr:related to UDP-glucose 4-epimerase [Phialocephala subalpina]